MEQREITELKFEGSVEILDTAIIEQIKNLFKDNYKCTFKLSDKRNPFFNDIEVSKGDFNYKRILIGKEDVDFKIKLLSEIIQIIHHRSLMPSEVEGLNNKNFSKYWFINDRKVLGVIKKGYIFEIRFSLKVL